MARDDVRELLRRDVDPAEYGEIRELLKRHSIAEDERDLPGLDLDADRGLRLRDRRPGRSAGRATGAARFYTELLSAFPDIRFDLTDIVIGPQGVCEEADVTGTIGAGGSGSSRPTSGSRGGWSSSSRGIASGGCSGASGSTRRACRSPLRSRQDQALARPQQRAVEPVALLDADDRVARIAGVARRGDRPERVRRPHDVRRSGPAPSEGRASMAHARRRRRRGRALWRTCVRIVERTGVRVKEPCGAAARSCRSPR